MVDLSNVDANSEEVSDQAFSFLGTDRFSGTAGELRFTSANGSTLVQADVDGDGRADMQISLTGEIGLSAGDFSL